MTELKFEQLLAAVPGKLLSGKPTGACGEMVFDSRKASADCIFLAFKGERVDGHDFIKDIAAANGKLVIGNDRKKLAEAARAFPRLSFLAVADPLKALEKLAAAYRKKFKIPVIGLTGSSGKTTTKDLLASILAQAGPALVTEGTLNNHWGVPQMVMRLRRPHRVAAFELGTSGFGELKSLSGICRPSIGFITTIGASHLVNLKSEKGVLKAKRELFDWIARKGTGKRTLLFNLDNPLLAKLHKEYAGSKWKSRSIRLLTLTQRRAGADVCLASRKILNLEYRFGSEYFFETPWGKISGVLPLPGAHNLANAMGAATLALASGAANVSQVVAGLEKARVSKLRSDLFRTKDGAVVYDDSYNANPTSVAALFEAARSIRTGGSSGLFKTVAVVGDMLELGRAAGALHRKMGSCAAREGVDVLLATGDFAREWVKGYRDVKGESYHGAALDFRSHADLLAALEDELRARPTETLVLVKGSRGARMENVVDQLRKKP